MKVFIWVVVAVAAMFLLHRVALWMEGKGWIYYKHNQASSSALGNAFLEVQTLVDPGKRLVLEARREEHTEEAESGDPPDTGRRDDHTATG